MLLNSTIDALKQASDIIDLLLAQAPQIQVSLFCEARIGSHLRHVHDHFRALIASQETGVVDYNLRRRDCAEETNLLLCKKEQERLLQQLLQLDNTKQSLLLISEIDCFETESTQMPTSLDRELLYLINHSIHHMAIIRYILENQSIKAPEHIGIAPSTASFIREEKAKACNG